MSIVTDSETANEDENETQAAFAIACGARDTQRTGANTGAEGTDGARITGDGIATGAAWHAAAPGQ